jgi:hypothetical protein
MTARLTANQSRTARWQVLWLWASASPSTGTLRPAELEHITDTTVTTEHPFDRTELLNTGGTESLPDL